MKRILTLFAIVFFESVALAQRPVDLKVTLKSPATNSTITSGTQFPIQFIVENVGDTVLKVSDSVVYFFIIDGNALDLTGSGQTTVFFRTGKRLAKTDTMVIGTNLSMTFPSSFNGLHEVGVGILVVNRSVDSARDKSLMNNIDTNNVNFGGGTTSAGDLQASVVKNSVNAYPNPATDHINMKVKLDGATEVAIRLVDIQGRVVYTENKGKVLKGEHVFDMPLKGFTEGYYFYQVVVGNETFSDKIFVKE